jgi:hypothetical protein
MEFRMPPGRRNLFVILLKVIYQRTEQDPGSLSLNDAGKLSTPV